VPLLEQDVNIRERAVVLVPQSHQFVVQDDDIDRRPSEKKRDRSCTEERHGPVLVNVAESVRAEQVTPGT